MTNTRNEPRLPPLPESEWGDDTREVMAGSSRLNIFTTLARHPKLLKRWRVFGGHVMRKNTLPARERELLILRTGFRCRSEYEFYQHTAIGLEAGLSQEEVQRTMADASAWSGDDALLVRATDELIDDKRIGEATWQALRERFDERQLIDIIFTVGQYTLVSMALNTLGVQIEDGTTGIFP
ncbi:MAG: carboxymuconolactone decarboxylase family protein [Myxococcales bacterium]|nr:carboxymuconolactone decarboxylase family protein [Myxococcales bacterium]MDD9967621.1 carboxymuconolactone decarboxylase family protein [Myxococcales bacterium]